MIAIAEDGQTVRGFSEQAQAAWNRGDSAAFAALFSDDAEFVDVLGRYHKGRAVIEAGHREIFDTIYKGSRIEYRVESVRFLRPHIAIVFLHARLSSHLPANAINAGDRQSRISANLHESAARPTLILAKDGGAWRIVVFQNTKVA